LTQQNLPETWITLFAQQNAATESGNAGIEIVLGERFPGATVFGLSLALAAAGIPKQRKSKSIIRGLRGTVGNLTR